jgi:hypothetical protein
MNGVGELLISLPHLMKPLRIGPLWTGPGNPSPIAVTIPNSPHLLGVRVYAQGLMFDPPPGPGPVYGLTDAVKLRIGI